MVINLLMFERAMRFNDPTTDVHDTEILNDSRAKVIKILEDAEMTLWALEDAGWNAPDDNDPITYAARLLFCTGRLDDLIEAVKLTREITLDGGGPREHAGQAVTTLTLDQGRDERTVT